VIEQAVSEIEVAIAAGIVEVSVIVRAVSETVVEIAAGIAEVSVIVRAESGIVAVTAAVWAAAEEIALATETFREVAVNGAAARLVAAVSVAALHGRVVHEVLPAWAAVVAALVVVEAVAAVVVVAVAVDEAVEVVDGSAT
jgi:hypothetical protein